MARRTDMTRPIERPELEDVLDAYVAEVETPSSATLAEWIQRYPHYERELTEFTVAWCQMQSLSPAEGTEPDEDDEALLRHGMNIVQNLLQKQSMQPPSQTQGKHDAFAGLLAQGRSSGLSSLAQLADCVELSAALVRKLDRRLIRYTSIPLQLIETFARILRRDVVTIARYLNGTPTLITGASYKAEQAPGLTGQQDFFEAVRHDPELSEERRQQWLSLAQPGVEGTQ
jgi:hypothetical protein